MLRAPAVFRFEADAEVRRGVLDSARSWNSPTPHVERTRLPLRGRAAAGMSPVERAHEVAALGDRRCPGASRKSRGLGHIARRAHSGFARLATEPRTSNSRAEAGFLLPVGVGDTDDSGLIAPSRFAGAKATAAMRLLQRQPVWYRPLGVMAAALLASAAFAASTAEARTSCASPGATVVAKAGKARIFSTRTDSVYVCRPGVRRRIGFYPREGFASAVCPGWWVGVVALTPRYAAWARTYQCDDRVTWTVSVSRIAHGAPVRTYPTGVGCQVDCGHSVTGAVGSARRIALTAHGALAWSAQDQFARNFFGAPRVIVGEREAGLCR